MFQLASSPKVIAAGGVDDQPFSRQQTLEHTMIIDKHNKRRKHEELSSTPIVIHCEHWEAEEK